MDMRRIDVNKRKAIETTLYLILTTTCMRWLQLPFNHVLDDARHASTTPLNPLMQLFLKPQV